MTINTRSCIMVVPQLPSYGSAQDTGMTLGQNNLDSITLGQLRNMTANTKPKARRGGVTMYCHT